jgi:hemolysin III
MPPEDTAPRYSVGEEIANSLTHGIGAALAIVGLVVLEVYAARFGSARHVVSCSIFGISLVMLYTASTLYHSIPRPKTKQMLRVCDHLAIFLLIAGTYTPFALVNLNGPLGWTLFATVWGLAVFGILFRLVFGNRYHGFIVGLYLAMGWTAVLAAGPLWRALETRGMLLLLLGGLAYTVGIVFYAWKRLRFSHAIWHLFVLAGSALHFLAIFHHVIPTAA